MGTKTTRSTRQSVLGPAKVTKKKATAPDPGRERYYANNIKASLGLTDTSYREFYAVTERVLVKRGLMGNIFRSCADKQTVQHELCDLVLGAQASQLLVPDLAERLQTSKAREAFQRLVCKISSNFRRRQSQRAARAEVPTSWKEHAPIRCTSAGSETSSSTLAARALSGERWEVTWLVVRTDGERRALCRPCELLRAWPSVDIANSTVDDMDLERLMVILEAEHRFERGRHGLCVTVDSDDAEKTPVPIDSERQWKAVVAPMLRESAAVRCCIMDRKQA